MKLTCIVESTVPRIVSTTTTPIPSITIQFPTARWQYTFTGLQHMEGVIRSYRRNMGQLVKELKRLVDKGLIKAENLSQRSPQKFAPVQEPVSEPQGGYSLSCIGR